MSRAIVLCLALLAGCEARLDLHSGPASAPTEPQPNWAAVYVDPLTGCQYLHGDRSYTPRLNSEGKPMCFAKDTDHG